MLVGGRGLVTICGVAAILALFLAGCDSSYRSPGKEPPPLESDQVALTLDGL